MEGSSIKKFQSDFSVFFVLQLKKIELIKDNQLRAGGLIFLAIGFLIVWTAKS